MLVHSVPCRLLNWRYHFLSGFELPHDLLHMAAHKLAGCFLKTSKGEIMIHDLWTSYHLSSILFIRNKSQVQPNAKGRRWCKGMNNRRPPQSVPHIGGWEDCFKGIELQRGRKDLLGWWINHLFCSNCFMDEHVCPNVSNNRVKYT